MVNIPVKIMRISEDAVIPEYATIGSAGFDIVATEEVTLHPMTPTLVSTGLKMQIPRGFELQIRPRSGLALKEGITVYNTPGTIDSDYRGEIKVILHWDGKNPDGESPTVKYIEKGSRIAQGVITSVYQAIFHEVESLEKTERGEGGFGSTGI